MVVDASPSLAYRDAKLHSVALSALDFDGAYHVDFQFVAGADNSVAFPTEAFLTVRRGTLSGIDCSGVVWSGMVFRVSPDGILASVTFDPSKAADDVVVPSQDGTFTRQPTRHSLRLDQLAFNNQLIFEGTLTMGPLQISGRMKRIGQFDVANH